LNKEGFSKQNQGTDVYQVRNGLQVVSKGSQQARHQVKDILTLGTNQLPKPPIKVGITIKKS